MRRPFIPSRHVHGFTLLEIMVVVVLVGILTTLAVLSIGSDPADRQLREEARRVEALFRLAGEQAALESRDVGMRVTYGAYEFLIFEPDLNSWVTVDYDKLLRKRELPEGIDIDLVLEDVATELPDDDDAPAPQAIFFSSGDVTPFQLILDSNSAQAQVELRVDALGHMERERVDYGL